MSSSSSYEPEEEEDASDSDFESGDRNTNSRPRSGEYIASEIHQDATTRASRSRAKRRTRETAFWDLRQQLTGESVSAYTALLAETAGDNASSAGAEVEGGDNYNITQNGIVVWTPKEKETFFNVLDRKGKNGIKEIAEAIGSKSELEVQEHLRLLHRGLERQHIRDRHTRTVVQGDVPAASEVRNECGGMLDQYAELVSLEEQYAENVAGRKKYHDAWIIDQEKAEEIDKEIEDEEGDDEGDEEEAEIEREKDNSIATNSTVHLTARLLNMEKWIRLSERFFMNFGGPRLEDNWTKIAYPDESPSLTADAFADFYALTLSVTRRLVQSSLFFAMSRLRKMRYTGHRKAQVIKPRDVRSALSVLNMKRDRSDYWTGLARRCNLDVVDSRHLKGWKAVPVTHNEVEDILSGVTSDNTASNEKPGSENAANGESSDDDSVLSDVRPFPEPQLYLSLEDEHAEVVDQKASNLEEQRLWERLGHPLPVSFEPYIKPEDEDAQVRRPPGERKTKEDLVDWRDRTLYRSEWEEYENEIYDIYEEISENRRKRRRVAREEPVRVDSPASTVSEAEEVDVEMDSSDEQQEEIDLSAVKHEGDVENEDDQDAEVMESAGEDTETEDQKPIISSQAQDIEWNDPNPPEGDTDDDFQSEEHKPPRESSQKRNTKRGSSKDEESRSISESDSETSEPDQKPDITHGSEAEAGSVSENMSIDPESPGQESRQQRTKPERTEKIKEMESEYGSDGSDDGDASTPRRFKQEADDEGDDDKYLPFGQHQINPDYYPSGDMSYYSGGWTKEE